MGAGVLRWGVAGALGVWLAASPCAAMSWNEYVASFGPHAAPPDVLAYLKSNPTVQAAPRPRFSEIHTETVDGSVAQAYRMTGFGDGLGHLEGTREERAAGSVRSGTQSLTMTTTLGGMMLVALDNKTTGAYVGLRRIEIGGTLFPPAEGAQGTLRYERVQLSDSAVVEEFHDCTLSWIAPLEENPRLSSRCTGTTKISQPNRDGSINSTSAPASVATTLVFRREVGWIFDQRTKVLDFKPLEPN